MSEAITDREQKYATKVADLLRLANDPNTPEAEAEQALLRASQLMERYALSEAAVAAVQGLEVRDEIVREVITYTGIYHRVLFDTGNAIGEAAGCKTLIGMRPKETRLTLVGFSKDVERARFLDASCQLQSARALKTWWATVDANYLSAMQKFKMKREFLYSFALGLNAKLKLAASAGRDEAASDVADRTGQTVDEARTSTELVLRSKTEQINDWVDQHYGTLRTTTRRIASGGTSARSAGYAAGQRADVGQAGVGGSRRALS